MYKLNLKIEYSNSKYVCTKMTSYSNTDSIGIAIQRGNASHVMGTTGSMGKLEELNYL